MKGGCVGMVRRGEEERRREIVWKGLHWVSVFGWSCYGIRYCTQCVNNQSKSVHQNTMQ